MNDEMNDEMNDMMGDELYDEMNDVMDAELYGAGGKNAIRRERIDGYLVSDIEDCLVRLEPDTIERFRKAQSKPLFSEGAGFGGNLWYMKRGMYDISLWIVLINMVVVPLIAAAYGWLHRGDNWLPYRDGYVYIFLGIVLLLEICPLGMIGDRVFWKHTKEILDYHGCKYRADKENPELKKKLAEVGAPSIFNQLAILVLDLLCLFYLKQITTALFLYFGYNR